MFNLKHIKMITYKFNKEKGIVETAITGNTTIKELIEYIRTEMDNAFIPILMVTSEANETRLSNIQQAGVSGICDKPFEPQTVKEMLFRVLDDA